MKLIYDNNFLCNMILFYVDENRIREHPTLTSSPNHKRLLGVIAGFWVLVFDWKK